MTSGQSAFTIALSSASMALPADNWNRSLICFLVSGVSAVSLVRASVEEVEGLSFKTSNKDDFDGSTRPA